MNLLNVLGIKLGNKMKEEFERVLKENEKDISFYDDLDTMIEEIKKNKEEFFHRFTKVEINKKK